MGNPARPLFCARAAHQQVLVAECMKSSVLPFPLSDGAGKRNGQFIQPEVLSLSQGEEREGVSESHRDEGTRRD